MFQTQSAIFSTAGCNTDTQREEEHEEEREVNEDVNLQRRCELLTTEAQLEGRRHLSSISR